MLSQPETLAERVMLENLHTLATQGWGNTVEFKLSTMAANGDATHASLQLVIPEQFEDDLTGTGGVVKKEERCLYCGGPNH
jgi:hypothetical protein